MAQNKTQANSKSADEFLNTITPEKKQKEAKELLRIFKKVTECEPVMWGSSIIGFDSYKYTNSSGTNDWMITGFSPRKQNFSLYIMQGFADYQQDLKELGKVKTAKSCLYINKLEDIDLTKLEKFLNKTVGDMRAKHKK